MSSLKLDGEFNNNLLEVLTSLCLDLQKQFDISPELLNSWINSPSFQKHLEESHATVVAQELTPEPSTAGTQVSVPELSGSELGESLGGSNELNDIESRCGKVLKNHSNGYDELCNEHKYLHERLDHEFVIKTEPQLIREKQFEAEWRKVNQYGQEMYERSWAYLQAYIERHYTRERLSTRELERVRPLLEANRRLFKSRIAINQVSMEGENAHGPGTKPKYVYGPHFDLFTPK